MKTYRLEDMTKGWFVGHFLPTAYDAKGFEVAFREFKKGQREARHVHKVALEITVFTAGRARMGESVFQAGDIVVLEPGEATDFEGLADGAAVVVKSPSVSGDKYIVDEK